MTLKEFVEKVDGFTEDERALYIPRAMKMLTPVSKTTVMDFQRSWDPSRWEDSQEGFKAFVEGQNSEIKKCIDLECSGVGDTIRSVLNMPPITMEAEI